MSDGKRNYGVSLALLLTLCLLQTGCEQLGRPIDPNVELEGIWGQYFYVNDGWVKFGSFRVIYSGEPRRLSMALIPDSSSGVGLSPARIENVQYDGTYWTFTSKFGFINSLLGGYSELNFVLERINSYEFEGTDSTGNPNRWIKER